MPKYKNGVTFNIHGSCITLEEYILKGRWITSCSICSKDKELWPYGSMKAYISTLSRGHTPCGCGHITHYSEQQLKVVVTRKCEDLHYKFIEWVGVYKGRSTPIKLYDINYDEYVTVSSIDKLFAGQVAGKRLKDKRVFSLSDNEQETINEFLSSGSFHEDTIFCKDSYRNINSTSNGSYWKYKCGVCSKDIFTEKGLCTGVFTSNSYNMKKGSLSCRCSKYYRWPENQITYSVKVECEKRNFTFEGWAAGYVNKNSKFNFICDKGHNGVIACSNFLHRGQGCSHPICRYRGMDKEGVYKAIYKGRGDEKDYLYCIHMSSESECFVKIGRSFNTSGRFGNLRNTEYPNIIVLLILEGRHSVIAELEHEVLEELSHNSYNPKHSFGGRTECFKIGYEKEYIDYIFGKNSDTTVIEHNINNKEKHNEQQLD